MRHTADEISAESWVLTTELGTALLQDVSQVVAPRPADIQRWRSLADIKYVDAALRLIAGRRRGASKFARASRMWLDPIGVEQATSAIVAHHKSLRYMQAATVVDLCAGVGGDSLALAARGLNVLAVDRDQGMNQRLRWNARVDEVADRVLPVRAQAERFARPEGAWVHVDPDRRADGARRARDLGAYEPGLDFLHVLMRDAPGGGLKLGPASDFEIHFGSKDAEIELISLHGECKEATVWFGAAAQCRRRATRLPEGATWTDRDADPGLRLHVDASGAWIFDPDPTLSRSTLLQGFAAAHGLSRFAAGVDYLCGPEPVESPFLSAFHIEAVLPLDLKRVRRELAARRVGALEVKTRGVSLTPEAVRARLRLSGERSSTLLLVGGTTTARAVIARREPKNPLISKSK